jgi:hypothetical protein
MPDRAAGTEQVEGAQQPTETLLRVVVAAGVPLRLAEYRRDRRTAQWLLERAKWAGDMVAAHGDILQFPGCLFVVAPDVVGDARATWERSAPSGCAWPPPPASTRPTAPTWPSGRPATNQAPRLAGRAGRRAQPVGRA